MKSVSELERDADRRKAEFEAKIDDIRERLTAQNLLGEALRGFAAPADVASEAMVDTARRNPLLLLTLAAGAGWFVLNSRKKAVRRKRSARSNSKRVKEIAYGNPRR